MVVKLSLKNLGKEDLEDRVERAHERYVEEKMSCPERTFLSVHGILESEIPREAVALLTGLGGGIGGTHSSVCGGVTGGVAALGLVYGRRNPAEESRERGYEVSRDFFCQFKSRFGSVVCGELIGDLLHKGEFDSEERRERCFQYTFYAAKLCVDLLSRYGEIYASE